MVRITAGESSDAESHEQALRYYTQAKTYQRSGEAEAALTAYDQAIILDPDYFTAYFNRGGLALGMGRLDVAVESYREAIRLKPDFFDAHLNCGVALRRTGQPHAAVRCFDAAIALRPASVAARLDRGNALRYLGQNEAALADFEAAIALDPSYGPAYYGRGNALLLMQRFEAAILSYDRCLAVSPRHALAHLNRGVALASQARWGEALLNYDRAIELRADCREAHVSRSILLLTQGDLAEGFKAHEWRYTREYWPSKRWRGEEDIDGKSIFIHCQDGLGDTLQFCRYLTLLAEKGARVAFKPQRQLRALMRRLSPEVEVVDIDLESATIPYDYHSPLLSLPFALGTTLETIPAPPAYLPSDPDRLERWRKKIGSSGFKVAICWQGSANAYDAGRSFPVAEFEIISRIPGVRLISVQKNAGAEQLSTLPNGMVVEDLGDQLDPGGNAFLDTAAVLQVCDLVVTCDTAVAHLAGGLGLETWVVLRQNPAWRWLRDRNDNPWYPATRLFRQVIPGDWRTPFADLEAALIARLSGGAA